MKKINLVLRSAALTTGVFLANPLAALAAEPTIGLQPGGPWTDLGKLTASSIVSGAIKLILVVAALLFFFMLVVGGIQWIIAGGDKAASENARKRITSALIGLAIVFVAWAIVALIKALFGVDILNLTIPSFQPS